MLDVLAHIHRADQANDDVSAELDRHRLNELLEEWPRIPQQRPAAEA